MQKKEPPADDDIPVDIPPLPTSGGNRVPMGLGAETDMESFSLRERLYSSSVQSVLAGLSAVRTGDFTGADAICDSGIDRCGHCGGRDASDTGLPHCRRGVFHVRDSETEGKMILFDKHAAHERIHFERMRAGMDTGVRASGCCLRRSRLH